MVKTIQARDISLYELEEKFGLQVVTDISFFTEWTENLLTLTDVEKQAIARVQSNYFNLNKRRPMSEEAVKMVVQVKARDAINRRLYKGLIIVKTAIYRVFVIYNFHQKILSELY